MSFEPLSRRNFLQVAGAGMAGLALDASSLLPIGEAHHANPVLHAPAPEVPPNMIGVYGPWADALEGEAPRPFSFRNKRWTDVDAWREAARQRFLDRVARPDTGGTPRVQVRRQYTYDGLHVEELTWQLPYGPPTEAILLKPEGATGKLPGVLGLHCHGGNKYFGKRKITKTSDEQHPMMGPHQEHYYGGAAWANELAKRGYAVLVHDTFTFGSRRVRLADVPEAIRNDVKDVDAAEREEDIKAYNRWAGSHEHIMSKSLFCGGTTWPGVTLAEDQRALDVLCARADVDASRIGIAGLSGGGLRTAYLGGADPRVGCAVCVGMMTTWRDYLLNKSFTHTWMIYVPLLPAEMEYPDIFSLRAPLPTMVMNDREDGLFTMPEMQRADLMLQEVFRKAGAPERYEGRFYPGPHKFDREMQRDAFDWFDRWIG